MKAFIFFARPGSFVAIISFLQPAFGAMHQLSAEPFPNYVVIGAFASEQNARKFTTTASSRKFDAHFDINPNRNLYYVFVMITPDREQAIAEARRLRKETPYFDAWVYNGVIGKDNPQAVEKNASQDIHPETEQTITDVQPRENTKPAMNVDQPITGKENVPLDTIRTNSQTVEDVAVKPAVDKTITAGNIEGKNFIFQLYRSTDNKIIDGDVEVVEAEKSKKHASYKGNQPVKVVIPQTKSRKVIFVCEVFGYRPALKEFDFNNPAAAELTVDDDGNVVVPFGLVRLQKGDIAVMYNVYFFKDAAIMRPESRYEVNNLLEMLKENPEYKIKIHGHTNGNSHGKIIRMGESKNYFSLTDSNDGYGSAKALSGERAETIREYLAANGIDETRMEVKAWGGKRPMFNKHSARAQENVRVEIEILEH